MPYNYDQPIVLSSTTQRQREETVAICANEFSGAQAADWSIKKFTLRGGKQEGVELIEVFNGKLRILVAPTRGMGILSVDAGDCRLGWDSPVIEVVHPHFIDRHDRGGLGWLDGFNEWLVRCGLEFAGSPGKDEVVNNAGDKVEMDLTLHGKIANIPASHVEVVVSKAGEICLRGIVYERTFLGPKLTLKTSISTTLNSDRFLISDIVVNDSASPQEFQLIYHTNFGIPLLAAGSQAVIPAKSIKPMNSQAAAGLDHLALIDGPQAGFIEQVFLMDLYGDCDGQTCVLLKNHRSDFGMSMNWSLKELPYFTLWKNLAAEADGYVVGFEPGTGFPFTRRTEREQGRVPLLRPMEQRRFQIECAILRGREQVAEQEDSIRVLSADAE